MSGIIPIVVPINTGISAGVGYSGPFTIIFIVGLTLAVYYVFPLVWLCNEGYQRKKDFFIDLIPFAMLFRQVVKQFNKLG